MKKKIHLLIVISILGLIALSFIQGYLINNTYKLKKDTFVEDTKDRISKFDTDINNADFESFYDYLYEYFVQKISEYKLGQIKKIELFDTYQSVKDSINAAYISAYKNEFKQRGVAYDLKFQKRLKSIVILDSIENDTLYFEADTSKMQHILGENFNPKDEYITNNASIETDYNTDYLDANGEWQNLSFDFEITTQNSIISQDWNRIVLGQMRGLFILSLLIFILVIGLLYYSIKNLITQKKIADLKTDFVNNITHEFKTPLATLSLATKMLDKENIKTNTKNLDAIIKTIDRQSNRLQKLTDQVLENNFVAEEITLHKANINGKDYLSDVLDDFLLSIKNEPVKLTRNFIDATIYIDRFYLTTALLNILENAIKYCQKTPELHCESTVNSNRFIISITDNGIGISEAHQKQLFDKFFRAEQSEIHNVKGLGLGLYYTNEIIKAHNGNITIKSQLGIGTTFTISIPLTD